MKARLQAALLPDTTGPGTRPVGFNDAGRRSPSHQHEAVVGYSAVAGWGKSGASRRFGLSRLAA